MEPEKNDACDKQERQLTAADAFLALLVARYFEGCAEFRDRIRLLFGLRTRRADARARLMNPTLKSSQNLLRIRALDVLIAKETLAAKPLVKELLERIGVVEMARQERRLYVAAERRIRRERSTRDQRQLTELTYAFVDKLYHEYRVDGSALSSLTDEDYTRVAAIVLARHRHAVPEAYEGEA